MAKKKPQGIHLKALNPIKKIFRGEQGSRTLDP